MLKRNTPPFIGGLLGLVTWGILSTCFPLLFNEDSLLNGILDSRVNAFIFYLAGCGFGIVYERRAHLLMDESASRDYDLLPDKPQIYGCDDIDEFSRRANNCKAVCRSSRLIWTVLCSMRFEWNQATVQSTLDTAYKRLTEEIPTRYRICLLIADVIVRTGFFGTLLGVALAMTHLQNQPKFMAYISIAFNTSLVAFVLGAIVSWAFTCLQEFDETILRDVYRRIEAHLIWPMHRPDSFCGTTENQSSEQQSASASGSPKANFVSPPRIPVIPSAPRSNGKKAAK